MSLIRQRLPWLVGYAVFAAILIALRGVLGLPLLFVILLLLIVALVVAIVLLALHLRQAAAAEEIEKTITTQADADIERSTPGQLAETMRLKEDLLAAIAQLKSSSRRTGADALATMPWYMVIGPAGAGKSELIKRSGLEFALKESSGDPRAVRGVGGTRGFSWWLAQEAVLLDMAGKTLATAAFDDSGDWVAFLETLAKQRPERPIQGVIVLVALDQIADQPEARIDSVARAARERLEELVQHLGVVFPVYLVFNRFDRVAGFEEFFSDLSAAERREPWGATLSMERATSRTAEELFDEEFGVLMGALSERRVPRMAAMGEATGRARAFAFPLQLERVRGNLRRFVRVLFETQAADAPLFRGFYFAAAAQSGHPVDRVLEPAVRTLGLAMQRPEAVPSTQPGSWFVRDLFTEVVFPDRTLATQSRGAAGRLRRGERIQIGVWGLAFVLLLALFTGFSCSNGAVVGRARRASQEAASRVTDETALVDNLRTLDRLRDAADELDRIHRHVPFFRRVGAWSGDVVRDPAVRLWMKRTTHFVIKPAVQRMEDSLRVRALGGPGRFLDDYYRFRAFRLLTDPGKIDPEDARVLTREVVRALADRLELGGADEAGRREYPALVARQMEFLSRNPRDLAAVIRDDVPEQDRALVTSMARIVRGEWRPEAFYAEMIGEVGTGAKPLTFTDLAGATPLMSGTINLPGAYTRDGWNQRVKPRAAEYGRMVRRDALMADAFGGRAPDLEHDLLALYAEDITRHWVEFLDGVEFAPQRSLDGVADQLARLAKGDSPIFKLLRGARDQLQGLTVTGTPLENVGRDFHVLADFFAAPGTAGQRTRDFIADLARKLPGQGGTPSTVQKSLDAQYLSLLAKAQADIAGLGPAAPIERLQNLLSPPPDQTNGVFEMVSFADDLSETFSDTPSGPVVARLLRAPVDAARRVVRERGLGPRVAAAWQSSFLQRFQQELGSAYPFAASATDASLDNVTACFGPQGYFWTFYTQYLAPFVNENGTPKSGEAPVSAPMLEFLRKAYAIRQTFFAAGATPALAFTVGTTPPQHDPSLLVRWVAFDCGGENVTYTMGPPRDDALHWPGQDATAGAELRVQAAPPEDPKRKKKKDEPTSIAVEPLGGRGVWGLFRLLDRAGSVSASGGTTQATWTLTAANGARITTTWQLKVSGPESPFARGFLKLTPPASP
jgi:type VI secretion system protein ImpL